MLQCLQAPPELYAAGLAATCVGCSEEPRGLLKLGFVALDGYARNLKADHLNPKTLSLNPQP